MFMCDIHNGLNWFYRIELWCDKDYRYLNLSIILTRFIQVDAINWIVKYKRKSFRWLCINLEIYYGPTCYYQMKCFDEAIWYLYRYYGMVMGVMLMGTHGKFLKVLELTITMWRWRKKWVGSLGRERQVCWDTKRRGKADSLLRESVMKFASWMLKNGRGWRYYF